jgi:hypothetical protein
MRSTHRFMLLAGTALVLGGCPYSGPVPLADPDPALFVPELVGRWIPIEGDAPRADIHIFRHAGPEYVVVMAEPDDATLARAWATRLGTALFLNVQELKEPSRETPEYSVVRVDLDGDRLTLRWLHERIGAGAHTAEELRARVSAQLDDPTAYVDTVVLVRR